MNLKIEYIDKNELKAYANNAKIHTAEQIEQIKQSIKEFSFNDPIALWHDNEIIEGHGRLLAVMEMPEIETVPVIRLDELTDEQRKAYTLVHNKLTMNTDFDMALLNLELDEIVDIDMTQYGFDLNTDDILGSLDGTEEHGSLNDRFIVPPFSILDSRQGYWNNRKQAWKNLGIKSEEGRDAGCCANRIGEKYGVKNNTATSIFDPVLCEIMYRWFCPDNGSIYDCFAGGSVRGIVADKLGYNYTGIDLRQEQIDANYENASDLNCSSGLIWHCDDSLNADKYVEDNSVDMVFTCPPYADLEVYSDLPNDISNMDYDSFCKVYADILSIACRKLKEDRFFVVVIGDVRDKQGAYRQLVDYTRRVLTDNGLKLYNDMIFVETVGTGAIRATKQFNAFSKAIKTHQNVLVFYKGDIKKIKSNFKELNISENDLGINTED